jgi:protein ImuA
MRLIACHDGKLLIRDCSDPVAGLVATGGSFSSGFADLDAIAPGGAFTRGAIHELLTDPGDGKAMFLAMLLAGSAANPSGSIIWCERANELYPPALAAHGFPLERLFLLHPRADPQGKPIRPLRQTQGRQAQDGEMIWAATESLRCKGIGAVIAAVPRLSRIEARRLQLAAERGGGVGLLLRHSGQGSLHHAAATRWLIRPAPGSQTAQRWTIQLLHGHGGRVGQTLCLEHCRETNHLHPFAPVADRQTATGITRAG